MKKITELVTKTEKPEQRAKKKAITFGSFKRAEDNKENTNQNLQLLLKMQEYKE